MWVPRVYYGHSRHLSLNKCRHEEAQPPTLALLDASIGHRGRLYSGWIRCGEAWYGHLETGTEF